MALRVLPVRERAIQAVMTRLRSISVGEGYNNNVLSVRRTRKIPAKSTLTPEIFLLFGKTNIQTVNSKEEDEVAPVEAMFFIDGNYDDEVIDTVYNVFIADLQRALPSTDMIEPGNGPGRIVDDTHPNERGRIVPVETISHQPLYSDTTEGQIIGKLEFEIRYRHLIENPNLWDDEDQEVVKED